MRNLVRQKKAVRNVDLCSFQYCLKLKFVGRFKRTMIIIASKMVITHDSTFLGGSYLTVIHKTYIRKLKLA